MALGASAGLWRQVTSRAVGEIPISGKTVVQFPLLLCVIAVFVYAFAYISYRNRGEFSPVRYLAHLFAVFGIVAGLQQTAKLYGDTGMLYRRGVQDYPKIYYAHFAAPLLPLILLIVFFILDSRMKRAAKADDLDDED
ncbi:hypothetical protein BH11ARM2_BH11ARM2_01430 [soil metagenome]